MTRSSTLRADIAGHVTFALIFSVLVNTLFLASPLYMMQLYGRVLDSRSLETLASLSLVLVLALVAMAAADAARGRLLVRAASRIERRLLETPLPDSQRHGDRLRDIGVVRGFFSGSAAPTLCDAPFTLLFLGVLFLIHPYLGLVASAGAGVILLAVLATRWLGRARERSIAAGDKALRTLSDTLDGDQGDLAMSGARPNLDARLSALMTDTAQARQINAEQASAVGAFNRMVRMLAHGGALATGAVLTLNGELAPAAMLASAILAGRALGPMETLLGALRQGSAARDAVDRLTKADTMPQAPVHLPHDGPLGVSVHRATLMIPNAKRPAIRSVSLTIDPGECISVAGASGSGKSSLVRAIAGLTRPTHGQVRVAGVDPAALPADARARVIGWMGQDARLYPGTVAENIARFAEVPPADILKVAEHAGARAAIEDLPQGFATRIGPDGIDLTPGMRQRVALARALFGAPGLVIFDQPTAHADAEGEIATLNALRRLKDSGTTLIVVSHKPVMAAMADRILVMKDGTAAQLADRDEIISTMRRSSIGAVNSDAAPTHTPSPRKEAAQ